jgi:hypothetical protein
MRPNTEKKDSLHNEVKGQFRRPYSRGEDDEDIEDDISSYVNSRKPGFVERKRNETPEESEESESESESESEEESTSEEDEEVPSSRGQIQKRTTKKVQNTSQSTIDANLIDTLMTKLGSSATKQVKHERNIIVHSVESELSPKFTSKINKIYDTYESGNPTIVVAPNWSENAALVPPSGFTLVVDKKTPIHTINFDPKKFGYGTIAICLTGAKFKDGKPVDLNSIMARKDTIMTVLNTKFDGRASHLNDPGSHTISSEHNFDEHEWHSRIHSEDNSFVSLNHTIEKDSDEIRRHSGYWLVVRAGLPPVSSDIFARIEEASADEHNKHTWESVFNEPVVGQLENMIKRNRERVAHDILESIGVNMSTIHAKTSIDIHSKQQNAKMITPDAETVTNSVYFKGSKAIYTRGTALLENVKSPFIMNQSPLMGSCILKGPNCTISNPFGQQWAPVFTQEKIASCAFPVDTGRLKIKSSQQEKLGITEPAFVWKGMEPGKENNRVYPDQYRPRNEQFKQIEKKLGRDPSWGQTELIPLITKLSE